MRWVTPEVSKYEGQVAMLNWQAELNRPTLPNWKQSKIRWQSKRRCKHETGCIKSEGIDVFMNKGEWWMAIGASVCLCVGVHVCVCVCVSVSVHACVCTYVCLFIHVSVRVRWVWCVVHVCVCVKCVCGQPEAKARSLEHCGYFSVVINGILYAEYEHIF